MTMSVKNSPPYKKLGELISKLRSRAGYTEQSTLAAKISVRLKTVQNWESGASRPQKKKMQLLAAALNTDINELFLAAGYLVSTSVTTFDKPFPVDALGPASFERFCVHFLSAMYPTADKVHRVGGQGHAQDGVDIDVQFPDKTYYTFQCKRVEKFEPEKVHTAVTEHTRAATKKYLLLTRVASPKARQAINTYDDWDIWDREDVSRIIRQSLSVDQQIKLVDTFFRGQRFALLGETEAGSWQTREQFFEAFTDEQKVFNHEWNVVGRDHEIEEIVTGLSNPGIHTILLIGSGGAGKTRVLKQATESFEQANKVVLIHFLLPSEKVTAKSLENLGQGKKLLVIDDAHDRDDLELLFRYASVSANRTNLLLSLRPYGLDYITGQASNFALNGECIAKIKLKPLNLKQATELATQVLKKFKGPLSEAKQIARLTLDCPLFIVIGAQVVAKENIHLEFAKNGDIFRSTLVGRFHDIITGGIGDKSDTESIKKLLNILALIQPFHIEDESIPSLVERVGGLNEHDINRLIRLLNDAGILFKRGGKYRLSPDLLADFIIEKSCIGVGGKSTGYAEQVFDAINGRHIEHVLINLGKLDWRLADGDPSNSQLLDGIWQKLNPVYDYDQYIRAVTAVAYYQPNRALEFVYNLIREGRCLRQLPNLIKNIAYNIKYLQSACECLWELGKSDSRELNSYPDCAIRILSELCAVEPNKPIEHSEVVVEFCFSLLDQESSWNDVYTPFDVLKGILKTEGDTGTSDGRTISWTPFSVQFSTVSSLRRKVVNTTIKLLTHPNIKVAVLAAEFLEKSLCYSAGRQNIKISIEEQGFWSAEFVEALKMIFEVVQSKELDSLVFIELIRLVSHEANYAEGETAVLAQKIIASIPQSLEFRTTLGLVNGYGVLLDECLDYKVRQLQWDKYFETLTNELLLKYSDGERLRIFLENILTEIDQYSAGIKNTSSYILYDKLVQSSRALAEATIRNALQDTNSKTIQFSGASLSKLLKDDPVYGLTIAKKFIEADSCDLHSAVGYAARALDLSNDKCAEEYLVLIRRVLSSKNLRVVKYGTHIIRGLAKNNNPLATDLLKCIDISLSSEFSNEAFELLEGKNAVSFQSLADTDIDHFLRKLIPTPELDKYWIETFLSKASKYHPQCAAEFFMARIEHAMSTDGWNYSLYNYDLGNHVPLRFRESEDLVPLLQSVFQWMNSYRSDNDIYARFDDYAGQLFNVMFGPLDEIVLEFIQEKADDSTPEEMSKISKILRHSYSALVFEQQKFVAIFLKIAKKHGENVLNNSIRELHHSVAYGVKIGILGEPSSKDIKLKENAEKVLQTISRFAPEYQLYEWLKKDADNNIKSSLKEREIFEDD